MELTNIHSKIYTVRGLRVMPDYDLAVLYEVETRALKQAVRRDQDRFPDDFMLRLTTEEIRSLRSQFVILENAGKGEHSKCLPFAFTEQGVAMLSSVLMMNDKKAREAFETREWMGYKPLLPGNNKS